MLRRGATLRPVMKEGFGRMTTDLYRKRPRRKHLNEVVMAEPGRFGSSRKKEAAARRFGNPPLWVFERSPTSGGLDCAEWEAQEKLLGRRCDLRKWQRRVGPGDEAACQGAEVGVWIHIPCGVPGSTPEGRS